MLKTITSFWSTDRLQFGNFGRPDPYLQQNYFKNITSPVLLEIRRESLPMHREASLLKAYCSVTA
jgi:hypothetical protein